MFSTMSVPMFGGSGGRATVGKGYNQRGARALPMPIFKGPTLSSFPYASSGAFDLGYMPEPTADTRQREAPTMTRSMSRSTQYPTSIPSRPSEERASQRTRLPSNNYSFQPPAAPNRNMYIYNPSMTASSKSDASVTEYDETATPASFSSPALSVDSTLAIKSPLFTTSSIGDNDDTPDTSPSSSINELESHIKSDMHYGSAPRTRHESAYAPPSSNFTRTPSQMAGYSQSMPRSASSAPRPAERNSMLFGEGRIPVCVRQPDTPNFSSGARMTERESIRAVYGMYGNDAGDLDVGTSGARFFTDSDLDLAERGCSQNPVALKVSPRPSRPPRRRSREEDSDHSSPFLTGRDFDSDEMNLRQPTTSVARSLSPASSEGADPRPSRKHHTRSENSQPYRNVSFSRPGPADIDLYAPSKYDSDPMLMPVAPPRADASLPEPSYHPSTIYTPHLSASPEPVITFNQHPATDSDSEQKHKRRSSRMMDAEHRHSLSSQSSHSSHSSNSSHSKHSGSEDERMKRIPIPVPSSHYAPTTKSSRPERSRRQSFYNMPPAVFDDLPSAKTTVTRSSTTSRRTTEGPGSTVHVRVNQRSSTYEITSPLSDAPQLQEFVHATNASVQRAQSLRRGERPDSHRRNSDSDALHPFQPPKPDRRYTDPICIDPLKRGVRWNDNLICPSPIFPHQRRKGWFNKKGEQLWTNDGAFKPPAEGDEYPLDLVDYPESGDGWMNEDGVRIDMKHRMIPKSPLKPALKRRN